MGYSSRRDVFAHLSQYADQRGEEIGLGKTSQPLIKSYVIETFRPGSVEMGLTVEGHEIADHFDLAPIDDDLYSAKLDEKISGFLEKINNRYWILYTTDRSDEVDAVLSRTIRSSTALDHLWISGILFNSFWDLWLAHSEPQRYIKMNFEFDDIFAVASSSMSERKSTDRDGTFEDDKRVSRFGLIEQTETISKVLPQLRGLLPSFCATSLVRFPSSTGSGGHDFYYSGKVTNRSSSFLDHRSQILSVCKVYQTITEKIEDEVWFGIEKNRLLVGGEHYTLNGSPVVIRFEHPIAQHKFDRFVLDTFERGTGPFRLWGNPIRLGDRLVHVYGLDMHLWQELYIELTPSQFTIILPRGSCGNTIHRLVANIQRFLEPRIKISIGNKDYQSISQQAIEGGVYE